MENAIIAQLGDKVGLRGAVCCGDLTQYPEQGNKKEVREKERKGEKIHKTESSIAPPTGLCLDVAGALLTKRVQRFALPSTTIYDDSDIEVYQRPTILERVWLL